jgi:hypothetical protein
VNAAAPRTAAARTGVAPAEGRIDWRFLLGCAELGRVAVAGPVDAEVRAAIEEHAERLVDLDGDDVGTVDVAVLVDPDLVAVRRSIGALGSPGAIWIEQLARRRRTAVLRVLREAGLEVHPWWHRPSRLDTRCFVALDRPISAATVLRTVAGRGRRGPVEVRLARWGHLPRWAADVSFLATSGATAQAGAAGSTGSAGIPAIASPNGEPVAALVTPRFAASRAIVGVTTITGGWHLGQVAKVARRPSDDALIVREAELLDQFVPRAKGTLVAPAAHRLVTSGGRTVLVEDAAQGAPLDRRAVRRDVHGALAAGIAWLERVPVVPPSVLRADGRGDALVLEPLRSIARQPWEDVAERDDLVARATAALAPLLDACLPGPFEHGDFSHPNLFRQAGGELVAIDWELARPHGLPLHDLTFLLAYLAESVERATVPAALAAAQDRATGPGGWARPSVERHLEALGVDPALRPALALACWTRYVAGRAAPLVPTRSPHRAVTLWRAALADAEAVR